MIEEYWVNVYKYPKLSNYCYSHNISDYRQAIYYSSDEHISIAKIGPRKTLYRIHVKLKPQYEITITGNCGQKHTFEEWQKCKACDSYKHLKYNSFVFS